LEGIAALARPRSGTEMQALGTVGADLLLTALPERGKERQNPRPRRPGLMSTKAERGTKRTCQNTECGLRFYDLNRDPITCPICGTAYELAASAAAISAAAPAAAERALRKQAKKPAYPVESPKPEDAPEAEGEEALATVEGEEEAAAGDEDETFLEEEEEDGSDMSGIIGGPVAETDEQQ
jgi:uncharacterized protein (TIGR02300 family)